jgi:hypothetical protein
VITPSYKQVPVRARLNLASRQPGRR